MPHGTTRRRDHEPAGNLVNGGHRDNAPAGCVPSGDGARGALPGVGRPRQRRNPARAGHDFGSLGYGEGYAFAQDNLCTFADNVVTLRAQRSRYFGSRRAFDQVRLGSVGSEHQVGLVLAAHPRLARVDLDLVNQRPPQGPTAELRALYSGWAAGYNAFLRSGKLRDPRCKGKPWVKPITVRDLFLRVMQIATPLVLAASSPASSMRSRPERPPPRRAAGRPGCAAPDAGRCERLDPGLQRRRAGSAWPRRIATGWCWPTRIARGEGRSASGSRT